MVDAALHLPSLSIQNFFGIPDLKINRLGRVTLIVGENGVGKSTLLDAVRIYAARGTFAAIVDVINNNEEATQAISPDAEEIYIADYGCLIYGRHPSQDSCISISANGPESELNIRFGRGALVPAAFLSDDDPLLITKFQGATEELFFRHLIRFAALPQISRVSPSPKRSTNTIPCETSGPGLMDNKAIARLWDAVALTSYEDKAVQALQLIYGDTVERVAMIGDERRSSQNNSRRAIVKMAGQERPVPLHSLGAGAARLFGTALALANAQNGILLIDEAENGIHHSRQADFWKMVLESARQNNIQVIATTHSRDTVVGFAKAVKDLEEPEAVHIRLERTGTEMRAVTYSRDNLMAAAKYNIETR